MNFTAGWGQAVMRDPVMQFALLQVRVVRSVIIIIRLDHHAIERLAAHALFLSPSAPLTVQLRFSSELIVPLQEEQLYFRVTFGNT